MFFFLFFFSFLLIGNEEHLLLRYGSNRIINPCDVLLLLSLVVQVNSDILMMECYPLLYPT